MADQPDNARIIQLLETLSSKVDSMERAGEERGVETRKHFATVEKSLEHLRGTDDAIRGEVRVLGERAGNLERRMSKLEDGHHETRRQASSANLEQARALAAALENQNSRISDLIERQDRRDTDVMLIKTTLLGDPSASNKTERTGALQRVEDTSRKATFKNAAVLIISIILIAIGNAAQHMLGK